MHVLTGGNIEESDTYTSSCEKYDPETDTWSSIPDMSMNMADMATAVIDHKIFVIGGRDNYEGTNRVEYFNDEENEWFVYS
jgi:N-acetylneuraminic acid mutarotase